MKERHSFVFIILAVTFCVSLVVSNIVAGKLYAAPFGIVLTSAEWLFPIVYIIGDVVPEVYGLKTARRVIWLGFAANVFAVAFFALTIMLPYPAFFSGQSSYEVVLGVTPRLLLASFIAYLCGTNVNAWVMVRIKEITSGRWLWMRTIGSTILGEGVDSLLFVAIAFWGVVPPDQLPGMIAAQAIFKTSYEAMATPLTYAVINAVKRYEGVHDI